MKRSGRKSKSRRGGFQPGYIPPAVEAMVGDLSKKGKVLKKYGKMAGRAVMDKVNLASGTINKFAPVAMRQVKKLMGKGRRFKKGSPEAKAHMAKLRSMRK